MRLAEASAALVAEWEADWSVRPGFLTSATRAALGTWSVQAVATKDGPVGIVALALGIDDSRHTALFADLWLAPRQRGRGLARPAIAAAEAWCRERGAKRLHASTYDNAGPAGRLTTGYVLDSRHMELAVAVSEPELPSGLCLDTMDNEHFDQWRQRSILEYARHNSGGERATDAAIAAARHQFARLLPDGPATRDHELLLLRDNGDTVAVLWLHLDRKHDEVYVYDVEVSTEKRGKGYGHAVMRVAERRAVGLDLSRVRLHVHEHNQPALRLYEKLGYQTTARHFHRELG